MADGQRRGGGNSKYFNGGQGKKDGDGDDRTDDNEEASVRPDIGLGGSCHARIPPEECSAGAGGGGEACSRREDNPFSFKHFLSRGACGSSTGGARPKVYPTATPPPSPSPSRMMSNSEMTSGLPDFVQDHLVIEQCYLNSTTPPQLAVDLEAIPPPGSPEEEFVGRSGGDMGFDLTCPRGRREVPLDLPNRLPLDLGRESGAGVGGGGGAGGEVGASKSLPDFLSDGPIRSQRRLEGVPSEPASPTAPLPPDTRTSPDHRLQIENERLRRELDSLRRQLSDQITRSETLEAELCLLRSQDQSDISTLKQVIKQMEDNVKRATKRAVTAEGQVTKLKEEVRTLACELSSSRGSRSGREGAAASSSAYMTDNERLASQLRNAANNAELSLRHLLLGVDNLRQLASSLEPQASVRHPLSSSDSQDEESDAGPAL